MSPTHHVFANVLAPFLCHPLTRVAFIAVYALYIFGAFYGCSLLRPNLTPSRLLVDDSPLSHYLRLAEQRIWSEGVIGRVYVNNAPNFGSNPEQVWMAKLFPVFSFFSWTVCLAWSPNWRAHPFRWARTQRNSGCVNSPIIASTLPHPNQSRTSLLLLVPMKGSMIRCAPS